MAEKGDSARTDGTTSGQTNLSRRLFLATSAAVGTSAAANTASAQADQANPPNNGGQTGGASSEDGDLILVNGKIHTMDEENSVVSSATIRNGRFASVGNGARARGPNTRVVNLRGRTVVPGIIDNHNHIVLMGLRPGYHTPLENANSFDEVRATLRARRPDVPEGEFITTIGGFHPNQFEEGVLPTRTELDAGVSDRPVYIQVSFFGPSTTNTLGRDILRDAGVSVGDDGSIGAFGPTGQALFELRQRQDFQDKLRSTRDAMDYATSVGVTTHLDQGAFPASGTPSDGAANTDLYEMHDPFLQLHRQGELSIRLQINFLHLESDPDTPNLRDRLRNSFQFFGDNMLQTGGIGEFTAQGDLGSDDPGAAWINGTRAVAEAGWRNENHSLGEMDFKTIIEGWEDVDDDFDINGLRWVVSHVPFITREYVNRLDDLGGGLSLLGWRYLDGTPEENGPPFRTILDNADRVGMSSDSAQIAPLNPWIHMYYAVTGKNAKGNLINDGEQISREEVLRLYTAENGWFLRQEDNLGTIEEGKLADLLVLSDDYFEVSEEAIKEIRPELTVVGGDIVHDTGTLT